MEAQSAVILTTKKNKPKKQIDIDLHIRHSLGELKDIVKTKEQKQKTFSCLCNCKFVFWQF
jgi:hypothetical protein